ncbi:MAG: prephenate dehydratase [Dethiobacter sp.]|nr:prephenate dehydratase [Dethiobacter sp.]
MKMRVAYLGPQGTFSEEAALQSAALLGVDADLLPCPLIEDCAEAVEDGAADYAVVPLENSLEGSVNVTLDILTTSAELQIAAELVLDIEHNLLATGGDTAAIRRIYSHPQALAQCRRYLRRHFAGVETVPVFSTAEAAALVSGSGSGSAAIGSRRAAVSYNLQILSSAIQDNGNRTRFVVLARQGKTFGRPVKTSLLFAVKNAAGSLYRVLQSFAVHGVNLTRIESRPAKRQLGEYIFFVDLDGTPDDQAVKLAIREAADEAVLLKLLGTYPVIGREAGA